MRLTDKEINSIRQTVMAYDPQAKVYLFGSRTDDSRKGGDIDILILSSVIGFDEITKIKLMLYDQIGEQKIDILAEKDDSKPFTRLAMQQGVQL